MVISSTTIDLFLANLSLSLLSSGSLCSMHLKTISNCPARYFSHVKPIRGRPTRDIHTRKKLQYKNQQFMVTKLSTALTIMVICLFCVLLYDPLVSSCLVWCIRYILYIECEVYLDNSNARTARARSLERSFGLAFNWKTPCMSDV